MADGRIEKTHNKANTVKCLLQNLEGGWMCVLKLYNTFHFFVYLTLFIIKCSLKNQVINYETGKQSPYCDTEFLIFFFFFFFQGGTGSVRVAAHALNVTPSPPNCARVLRILNFYFACDTVYYSPHYNNVYQSKTQLFEKLEQSVF